MPYLLIAYAVVIVAVCVDIAVSDGRGVRGVPKIVWALGCMALPLLGPIAWLALGRPWSAEPTDDDGPRRRRPTTPPSVSGGSGPTPASAQAIAEEAFRKQARERAEQQRRIARREQGSGE